MESETYKKLIQFESNLDFLLKRKKLDLQESISKIQKTLRIFVSNSAADQYTDANLPSTAPSTIPSWTLRIDGKILDVLLSWFSHPQGKKMQNPKFSAFIKSVRVELLRDQNLYPNQNVIEWTKNANQSPEFDGFEIKRIGDHDVPVKILIQLDHTPDKYKLSNELAGILDIHTDTKANIIMALWQYIKVNRLQDQNDKRIVNCDERLERIFKAKQILFPQLPDLLNFHLSPADPIVIEYTIKVDKEQTYSRHAYDVQVELNDSSRIKMQQFIQGNQQLLKDVSDLDEKIQSLHKQLHLSQQKHAFLTSFTKNPVQFVESWIKSQSADMNTIVGEKKNISDEVLKEGILWYLMK